MLLMDLFTKRLTSWVFYRKREDRRREDTDTELHYVHIHTDRKICDLIAPEGQSTGTDVQNYVWSQTCKHHGFVVLRGRQLRPHDVQLAGQCRGAGRAGGGGAAELPRPVLITENM